jgi:hypothetical protein
MSRINLEGLRTRDIRHGPGFVFQNGIITPATGYVVTIEHPPMMFMNPAGAVNILLPTSNAVRRGTIFIFVNLSANVITLQTDGGVGFTTALTVAANGSNRVVCTGNVSQVLGWAGW